MKITPEEIRSYSFSKSFRGYDKEAVDQFLNALSQEWEKEKEELAGLKTLLEKTEKELNRLKEVETVMFKAMKEADDNAAVLIENATARAANIVGNAQNEADKYFETKKSAGDEYWAKAENKAEEILQNAENEKAQLLTEANEIIERMKEEAKADIESSEKEYNSLDIAKQQLLYDLKSLLGNTSDRLENVQTKYSPDLFDAKKLTVNQITKADVVAIATPKSVIVPKGKIAKPEPKKAIKPSKNAAVSSKKVPEKKAKSIRETANKQAEIDSEDDGLPTVQKILALTEEVVLPAALPAQDSLPELETKEEPESQNGSFFDAI